VGRRSGSITVWRRQAASETESDRLEAMALDMATQEFLANSNARPSRSPDEMSLAEFRAAVEPFRALGFDREEVKRVENFSVPVDGAPDAQVRLYWPDRDGPLPVMVWAHGGSWVRVSVDLLDGHFRVMANRSGCAIAAVDYRLSPEARFPRALDEVHAVARWLKVEAERLSLDPARIGVGGESSGGNLAAAVALLDRQRHQVGFVCQVLLMPVLDLSFDSRSWDELGRGYLLTRRQLQWAVQQYAPGIDVRTPLLSPICDATKSDLPPAIIRTGEFDPLKDEGAAYAGALRQAGTSVSYVEVEGLIHPAIMAPRLLEKGALLVSETAAAFGTALRQGSVDSAEAE
jgi:acetyl esterase